MGLAWLFLALSKARVRRRIAGTDLSACPERDITPWSGDRRRRAKPVPVGSTPRKERLKRLAGARESAAACSGAPHLRRRRLGGARSRRRIGALAQQRCESLLRHRLAEQKPLAVVAAHADQRQRVGRLLDADADRKAAETVREVDHGLAQRGARVIGATAGDEAAVELELGEGQFRELRHRGIVAAEVVDGELDVERREPLGDVARQREIVDDLFFADVDDQARPVLELGW